MIWIQSHKELLNHPKVIDLMTLSGWDLDTTLGKLHRFWWWCVDYAENGDLRKHNDDRLAAAAGVLPGDPAKVFVQAMVTACWLDRDPYFRIHDWWDHAGPFLQSRYKRHPERWQAIRILYTKNKETDEVNVPGTDQERSEHIIDKEIKRKDKERTPLSFLDSLPKALDDPTFRSAWSEWERHRREIKHELTFLAVKNLFRKCERWGIARSVAAIENSIAGGYRGIFEDRADNRPKSGVLSSAEFKSKPWSPHGN